jgi:hypothetical protein
MLPKWRRSKPLLVYENHNNIGGSTIWDIDVENFCVTVGGRNLI